MNGTELPNRSTWRKVSIPVDFKRPRPNKTTEEVTGSNVDIGYRMESEWNGSRLLIQNADHTGTYYLKIHVSATEAFVNDGDTSAERSVDLPSLHFEYEERLAKDQRRCNGVFEDFNAERLRMTEKMRLLLTAPDPHPELAIGTIFESATAVNERIAAVAAEMGVDEAEFRQELNRGSRMSEEVVAAQRRVLRIQQSAETNIRPYRKLNTESAQPGSGEEGSTAD